MRSSLVVRASDCQCTKCCCNGPGFDPSIRRHSGIWGAADEAVLNTVRTKRKKSPKNIKKKKKFEHHNSLVLFYLSWDLSWCRISFLKGDLQFSKNFKNTICIGVCALKCTVKRFILFTPLLFLPYFVLNTEFKGSPEYVPLNVLYHTSLRNYVSFSLQVPSILSILLAHNTHQLVNFKYV